MSNIHVDSEGMLNDANIIFRAGEEYKANVDSLYKIVEEVKGYWQGSANKSYSEAVTSQKEFLKNLGDMVNNYAVFLRRSVAKFNDVQEENIERSKKL